MIKAYLPGRYYNANGFAVGIVAVVTKGVDWAAYIGSTNTYMDESQTMDWIAMYGCKLSEYDARHFFPELKLPYRG